MGNSWKIGRVAGINLFLHPTLLLFAMWGLWAWGVDESLFVATVFGCVLLHELGHALAAKGFGIPTRDITLTPIGGVARLERMPRAPGAELVITLAGPLVNVGIAVTLALALWVEGGFTAGYGMGTTYLEDFATKLLVANVVLAVFNMLPAFPMDGGRVLRAALTNPIGRSRATEIALGVGRVLAVGLAVLGLYNFQAPMLVILAAFVLFAGNRELASVRADEDQERWGGGPDDEITFAPQGYRWVERGNGFWQLAPIRVESNPWGRGPWN